MWNCDYANASTAVAKHDFMDIVFADDLNCTKALSSSMSNSEILDDIKNCQAKVHKWGEANRVAVDPSNENCHVLYRSREAART